MKRIIILFFLLFMFQAVAESSPPSRQFSNTSGQVIDPDKVTSNEDVIYLYLQQGVEVYKDASIVGADLASNIAITSSGNMAFSGTTNLTGTFQLNGTTVTATAANINNVAGVTASSAELNILDGATLSTAELNYVDGVTSAVQTQLDGKSATTGNASIVTVGTIATGNWAGTAIPVAYGGTGATTAANARSNLSVASSGANSDITSLTGLTTPLAVAYGGTGYSAQSGCVVTLSADQDNLTNSLATVVQFNTESYDLGNEFNTSTYKFTATNTGKYLVNCSIMLHELTANSQIELDIFIDGVLAGSADYTTPSTTADTAVLSRAFSITAGSYLQVKITVTSGGNLVDITGGATNSVLTITRL